MKTHIQDSINRKYEQQFLTQNSANSELCHQKKTYYATI